jgi:hypothetical protein
MCSGKLPRTTAKPPIEVELVNVTQAEEKQASCYKEQQEDWSRWQARQGQVSFAAWHWQERIALQEQWQG